MAKNDDEFNMQQKENVERNTARYVTQTQNYPSKKKNSKKLCRKIK